MTRSVLVLIALFSVLVGVSALAEEQHLTILQWNLENVFDAEDDPGNPMDDEFTPGSWRRWTEDMYQLKLSHIARAIATMDADICCLEELENRSVVDDLVAALRTEHGRHYEYVVHRESTDHRGIDLAVLSTVKPDSVRWLTPVSEQRDILIAEFSPGGRALTIAVNHWKSRWGGVEATAPLRMKQAEALRREIDEILKKTPRSSVVVVGDFNDNFDEPSLVEGLKSTPVLAAIHADASGRFLYNLHGGLPPALRGTFYYRRGKTWNSFDSMSVSQNMLPGGESSGGWRVVQGSYEVMRPPFLMTDEKTPKSFRRFKNMETGEWSYQEGYSDHFPVRVKLES